VTAGEGRGALSRKPVSGTRGLAFLPVCRTRRARVTGMADGIGRAFPCGDGRV